MKKRRKKKSTAQKFLPFVALFLVIIGIVLAAVFSRSGRNTPPASSSSLEVNSEQTTTSSDTISSSEEPEDVFTSARLCFAGDIVQHTPLNNDAYNSANGKYDYAYMFKYARQYFEAADYSSCCIETTLNGANFPYSGYPQFCSPSDLAVSLKEVGIDIIQTASNHSNDTYFSGITETLNVLDSVGLDHVGTYRTQEERDANSGIYVKDVNGISIALLDYTYNTNGISTAEYPYAVNIFNSQYDTNGIIIDTNLVKADMAAARKLDTDLIIVTVHWGEEYTTTPVANQTEFADLLFEEGADVIIGGHPHVPEPMEVRQIDNGDGTTRTGFLVYSLGNFISNQNLASTGEAYTDLTAILNMSITKNVTTGEITFTNINFVPMFMLHPESSNTGHYILLDIKKVMAEFEAGDTTYIGKSMYERMKTELDNAYSIFKSDGVVLTNADPASKTEK